MRQSLNLQIPLRFPPLLDRVSPCPNSVASRVAAFSIYPEMETDEYLKLADVEDRMWYFRSLHGRLHDAVLRALGNPANARVLDAGCGTGGLLRRFQQWHPTWDLQGIDLSPVACDFARRRGCVVTEASVTALPFADQSFDAIVCGDVLYHISEHAEALGEFARCLRPGGVLALNVPAYRWLWSYHDERVQSKHRFTRGEVLRLLRGAKLLPTFATYWNTLPFPLIVLRRKVFPPSSAESDVKLSSPPVEALFNGAMRIERTWNRFGLPLPFGSSVFAIARKPEV